MTASVLINRRSFEPFLCLDLVFFLVTARQTFQCHEDFAAFLCCAGSAELLFWGPQRSQRHDFDTFSALCWFYRVLFGVRSILSVMILILPVLCWFYSVVLGSTAFSES